METRDLSDTWRAFLSVVNTWEAALFVPPLPYTRTVLFAIR
jgi:hypothetical protein